MKIQKIEIKKELLDISEGRQTVEFAVIPPFVAIAYHRDGEIPDTDIVARKVTYYVKRVWNGNEYQNYLVNEDDRGIFSDLVTISAQDLKKSVEKETKSLYSEMKRVREVAQEDIRNARWKVSMSIKKLPWYSRLFNNF